MSFDWKLDITSILTFIAILVALFGRDFVAWLKRPNLHLTFQRKNKSFFHEIDFPLFEHGGLTHYSQGINCLFKVKNKLRKRLIMQTETAKSVEAKITYIYYENEKYTYHPTNLNWSGARGTKPIDIISGSHHFLDFIRFYNYENEFLVDDLENFDKKKASAIKPNEASADLPEIKTYFELWVPSGYGGIKSRFSSDGVYKIHFVINGENCGPYKYIATVEWNKAEWNNPKISLKNEN